MGGDEEAIKLAEAWREARKMDLWNGARRVHAGAFLLVFSPTVVRSNPLDLEAKLFIIIG
jgi:hypothetical protein